MTDTRAPACYIGALKGRDTLQSNYCVSVRAPLVNQREVAHESEP